MKFIKQKIGCEKPIFYFKKQNTFFRHLKNKRWEVLKNGMRCVDKCGKVDKSYKQVLKTFKLITTQFRDFGLKYSFLSQKLILN